MSVFEEIRAGAAYVAERARHVRINETELEAFAGRVELNVADDDPGHFAVGDAETTAAFVLALDSVNFGSGYFPVLRKRHGISGYHTIASCLREFALRQPIASTWLAAVDVAEVTELFEQDGNEGVGELMGLFCQAFNDLGAFIDRVGDGRALGVVEAADGSAAKMVKLLDEMSLYHDVHDYEGREVPLYKRAQITPFDLSCALGDDLPEPFSDLDQLTMFADNLVPHVLRVEGVLEFEPALVERINAGEDIPSGSHEEVEIRACGLHAVEQIVIGLMGRSSAAGDVVTAGEVDGILWRLGGQDKYKAQARHRSRCHYY